ncbi:MAG: nucleotidyltransferase family protein [Nitrospinota bacterium]|nr:nucleotidyltransferase family protein [Nitrospinota bacterium]
MSDALKASTIDAVVLCGGLGTRLQSVLKDTPKPMADFDNRPFLDLLIEYVGRFGFQRFILCSGHKGNIIRDYFEKKNDGRTYIISQETSPLGTAGAIKYAEDQIKSDVFLGMNGDSFCDIDLTTFIDFHYSKQALASIALVPLEDASDYGGVSLGAEDEIIHFDEKSDTPSSGWVNAGIYLFNKQLLESIPAGKVISLEKELFPSIIGKGLYGFATQNQLLDIGTPERLERARQLLIELN